MTWITHQGNVEREYTQRATMIANAMMGIVPQMYSAPGINEFAPEGFEVVVAVADCDADAELKAPLWGALVVLDAALFPALAPISQDLGVSYFLEKMCALV